jgi:pentatricopeptide repeat protein
MTVLFLACSNCKWPEFSIRKTDSVRVYLKNRGITPNKKMYSAMIQAYGKSGAIYEAFNVVDEMLSNKIKPDIDVFRNLLCACISNQEYGFKYALNV